MSDLYSTPTVTQFSVGDFYDLHKGKTCLIVGVGPNLHLTPPTLFNYPSFSVNTIYKTLEKGFFDGWKPTYFVGVDERLRLEDGAALVDVYRDVPKFFPAPDWDDLSGENIYRFQHRTFGGFSIGSMNARHKDSLTKHGITYRRVMDAVFQIAWYMGFTTMLMIGVQHKPYDEQDSDRAHFWGVDEKAVPNQPNTWWFEGYKYFAHNMPGVKVLNISEDTYVPEDILPRDDYRNWSK